MTNLQVKDGERESSCRKSTPHYLKEREARVGAGRSGQPVALLNKQGAGHR